ncbi:protein phosphatase 1F [Stomoxys calcitrans]|uniref:protein phosphatase 1F n=1 Tax=Stomoxys calcitrans TaxID=35570 RepID=UPI0027E36575|nr:protein phosphatase 1F [Stomoxys calcitrans]
MTSSNDDTEKQKTTTNCCQPNECRYLHDLQDFLRDVTKDAVSNNAKVGTGVAGGATSNDSGGGGELRSLILTRNTTETYPVTETELDAEVITHVWHRLQQCPEHFRLGLAKLAEEEIGQELKTPKVREELAATKQCERDNVDVKQRPFDLAKLQKFITQYLEKIFLRLSDNSKEDILITYAECNRNAKGKSVPAIELPLYAAMLIKNKPRKMEDRHICLPRFGDMYELENQYSFFGVFDGHSGSLAAVYAANQIPFQIAKHLKIMNATSNQTETDYYREVLEASFIKADANFVEKALGSGTTAVCALLKYNTNNIHHLYVAWVGDSRCLLVSPSVSLQLVKPHKPDSMDERKRIESAETGGAVVIVQGHWRVNGIINVSRSIGDHSVKAVIAEPDFVDVPLQASHDFLILGSDGLWDHVSETEIVNCTYKALLDTEQNFEDIPRHLIELAKQGDSQDNITAILVLLKDRSNIIANYTKCCMGKPA